MLCRTQFAVINYNKDTNRKQATIKMGEIKASYRTVFHALSKKKIKESKDYSFINDLMDETINFRQGSLVINCSPELCSPDVLELPANIVSVPRSDPA